MTHLYVVMRQVSQQHTSALASSHCSIFKRCLHKTFFFLSGFTQEALGTIGDDGQSQGILASKASSMATAEYYMYYELMMEYYTSSMALMSLKLVAMLTLMVSPENM